MKKKSQVVTKRFKVDNRHKSEIEMHSMFEKQANERKGEWFNISLEKTKQVFASFT